MKKAILHRKNAFLYKTRRGANVGDIHISLIPTCELCGTNPLEYLTELQRHAEAVEAAPTDWLPWKGGPQPRVSSPFLGRSTLTTRAPRSASIIEQ